MLLFYLLVTPHYGKVNRRLQENNHHHRRRCDRLWDEQRNRNLGRVIEE